ncbi:IclR family transcriptional regulator [Halobacillus halophilus]|uniref:Glycerol operon regulatory protein n=1 Tax=Halobacillus halophilus (strain ATCC 35676 / DSM 2266 / JCM 20832 / KCTC 3685 / LMG 17431 / NBRC 102448 / NCIMB 2269) TaxID=866895 RepID=I0JIA0_HALH3|nr:IclR family transcriptional regulator [Halobacillus halophilus]ASF38059.1 IclR family transcriptional regulator [Halobacillus halophilus]CCG43868.1 IclR family transcription regulator [Halobacillus halophilus DSM 2266]
MSERTASTVQSVDRALTILQLLQENPDGLGVTEIAHRLDVAKSTVHRLLASLKQKGYVRQDDMLEKYRLGLKLLELGETVSENMDIRTTANPYLVKLAQETGETIHLGIREEAEVIYVDKVERYAPIRMYSSVGKRAPLYCTGIGKALLAFASNEAEDHLMSTLTLKKFTPHTITDKDKLKKHLGHIRERGYSIDNEEHEEGIRCTAAPIWNHRGEAIAAISVAGSTSRMTEEKVESCTGSLLHTALEISRRLGY